MSANLKEILSSASFADYPRHSRIHRLNSFDTKEAVCFVKREDELGFGISGSKVRKYLSLIPFLLSEKIEEAVLIGSPYSNHVLSLSQLLIENGISPILFLVGYPSSEKVGNFLLTSLLIKEEQMHFFPKSSFPNLEQIAHSYAENRKKENMRCFVVPMGASLPEAFLGSLTLAEDILSNEDKEGILFDHIILDSGTGMMAASLILAFAYWKRKTHVHVIQVADDPKDFELVIARWQKELECHLKHPLTSPLYYSLYQPESAISFGSVNNEVFETIKEIASQEGFFTDPIYSAKMFRKGKAIIKQKQLTGNILFIHSGGALSLFGFQSQLLKKSSSLMEVNEIYKLKLRTNRLAGDL